MQKDSKAKKRGPYVIKDESQPRCALCHEPFTEEWDEDLQEWVYRDAVRLPAQIASLPSLDLPSNSIVKVGLLPADAAQKLKDLGNVSVEVSGVKRKAEWDGNMQAQPPPMRVKSENSAPQVLPVGS
jgi:uncharacterized protein YceK